MTKYVLLFMILITTSLNAIKTDIDEIEIYTIPLFLEKDVSYNVDDLFEMRNPQTIKITTKDFFFCKKVEDFLSESVIHKKSILDDIKILCLVKNNVKEFDTLVFDVNKQCFLNGYEIKNNLKVFEIISEYLPYNHLIQYEK